MHPRAVDSSCAESRICPSEWIRAIRSPRLYGTSTSTSTSGPTSTLGQPRTQFVHALARLGRDEHRTGQQAAQLGQRHRIGGVDLVHHDQFRRRRRIVLAQITSVMTSRTALICSVGNGSEPSTTCSSRSASVDLLQRRAECLDQLGRQVPNETDRVGQHVLAAVVERRPAGCRIEGGEQCVLHQHTRAGQRIEQAGLAGVGVTDDRHRRNADCAAAWSAWCRGLSSSP